MMVLVGGLLRGENNMRVELSLVGLVPYKRGSRVIPAPFCHMRTHEKSAAWKSALK